MSGFHRLRKATPADLAFIVAVEANPEHTYVHSYSKQQHAANLAKSAAHYFIAESKAGEPLGFAILFDNCPGRIEWRRIIVDAPGRGVGKAFMRAVIEHFREMGAQSIWLDVYEVNARARHVYSALGFAETGRKPYEANPDVTLVIMELTLV